jgi:hypothetical protein
LSRSSLPSLSWCSNCVTDEGRPIHAACP